MKPPKPPKPEKTFPQYLAAFLMNDFKGIATKGGVTLECAVQRLPADLLGQLVRITRDGFIDRQQLRRIVKAIVCAEEIDEETAVDIACALKLIGWAP